MDVMCAICMETVSTERIDLRCSHKFHIDCLQNWLPKHGTCPTCRSTSTPMLFVEDVDTMPDTRFLMKCDDYWVATDFDADKAVNLPDLELIPTCPYEFIETFNNEREAKVFTLEKPWDSAKAISAISLLLATSSLALEVERFAIRLTINPASFVAYDDVLQRNSNLAARVRQEMEAQWARVGLLVDALPLLDGYEGDEELPELA